jgi:cell wall-associated NlpC family hydrolase
MFHPLFSIRLALVAALVVSVASTSSAAPTRPHRVIHRYRAYAPLQPFSLDLPAAKLSRQYPSMRMAYYAPRAVPRAARIEENDDSDSPAPEIESGGARPTVAGSRAVLRNGIAYAPTNAPQNVKSAIWAVNTIRRKPYVWGGGHGSFSDRGYDCSGTVSFALHHAGVLNQPLPSSDLLRYGQRGRGRWITVYSRRGHTFAIIAGLRLDTTDFRYGGDVGPRWHTDGRDTGGFSACHPVGL